MSVDEELAYVRKGFRRKLKAGAVELNGDRITELILKDAPGELVMQVGRNRRRVTL